MPNYSRGKIYKIWSPSHPDDIYIGSTTQPLSKRIGGHRKHYRQYKEGKKNYMTSFKILEYGDARIELIEDCMCERGEQLTAREGHFIRSLDCVNKIIPGRTKKQWYQDNKERLSQQQKQYREDNKEQINQYHKQYGEANRDKLNQKARQYHHKNKDKISQQKKQYREANRDKMLQKHKQYYQDNKKKLKEKVTCECGAVIVRKSLTRHKKTNKHKRLLQALNTAAQFAA